MKYRDIIKYSDPTYFWFTLVIVILLLGLGVITFIYSIDGPKFAWVFFFCISIICLSWCIYEYYAMIKQYKINSEIDTKIENLKSTDTFEDDVTEYKLPKNFSIFDYNEVLWKQNN